MKLQLCHHLNWTWREYYYTFKNINILLIHYNDKSLLHHIESTFVSNVFLWSYVIKITYTTTLQCRRSVLADLLRYGRLCYGLRGNTTEDMPLIITRYKIMTYHKFLCKFLDIKDRRRLLNSFWDTQLQTMFLTTNADTYKYGLI